ncbi:MAG TPA: hypothetical protein VLH08_12905 [Acidobacteriota bacterium]|nr:hypothetical protein [Acidobacteriota bacterium]
MDIQKANIEKQISSGAFKEQERLQRITQESDLIFVGTVIEVGPPPKDWSGYMSSYQTVRYKIEQILKGQYDAPEISIEHIVVHGSKTAEPGETPKLSTAIFYPGASLIVSAGRPDVNRWTSGNEVIGAVPNSADWLRRVEALLPRRKQ